MVLFMILKGFAHRSELRIYAFKPTAECLSNILTIHITLHATERKLIFHTGGLPRDLPIQKCTWTNVIVLIGSINLRD